jgi:hypothetical protein
MERALNTWVYWAEGHRLMNVGLVLVVSFLIGVGIGG